jgi:hypothetical protein
MTRSVIDMNLEERIRDIFPEEDSMPKEYILGTPIDQDFMCEPGCFLWTKAKERKLHLKATHFLHQRPPLTRLRRCRVVTIREGHPTNYEHNPTQITPDTATQEPKPLFGYLLHRGFVIPCPLCKGSPNRHRNMSQKQWAGKLFC